MKKNKTIVLYLILFFCNGPARITAMEKINTIGETLYKALENNNTQQLHTILKDNKNLANKIIHKGLMPLLFACKFSNLEICTILINHKANVNEKAFGGWTPLHFACERGFFELIKLLIDKGAQINTKDQFGFTPLHALCSRNNIDSNIVTYLIEKGAHVKARTNNKKTPYDIAPQYIKKVFKKALYNKRNFL